MSDWRTLLHARFAGRAEPVFVGRDGLRSAASLWSGARAWTTLLRTDDTARPVHLVHPDRLLALQLLIAALWDARTLHVASSLEGASIAGWRVEDGRVTCGTRDMGRVASGGWPIGDMPPATPDDTRSDAETMPSPAVVQVAATWRTHAELWSLVAAWRDTAGQADVLVLEPFDARALDSPEALLRATLLPLLMAVEVREVGTDLTRP